MKKDYTKEKQDLFDEIQAFLNSEELASVRTKITKLQRKIDAIPNREMKVCNNFTNLSVAFYNMMSWADDFNWDRNKKCFDHIARREAESRELHQKLKDM